MRLESFEIPDDLDGVAYYENNYGIYKTEGKKPVTIRINVTNDQQAYVRSLPLHHFQKEVGTNPECLIFEYYLCPEIDFDREVLGLGKDFGILEPVEYRKHIAEEVCLKNYK